MILNQYNQPSLPMGIDGLIKIVDPLKNLNVNLNKSLAKALLNFMFLSKEMIV